MSAYDLQNLLPLTTTAAGSILVMLLIVINVNHKGIMLGCLIVYLASLFSINLIENTTINPLFVIDGFAKLFMGLILLSGAIITLFSYSYFNEKEESPKAYYILLLIATLGALTLCISNHFISLFLGLEILSVSLYVLIAYLRNRSMAIEAGMKYLIMAAFSSAFLLFGMALIYFECGSMAFGPIANFIKPLPATPPFFITGMGFLLVGAGFKLSTVPFHLWAADVYQGAPAPITAFIASISKGGMLIVVFRFLGLNGLFSISQIFLLLMILAIASMLVGNILALRQNNLKRILAYSSIANMGYLLTALLSIQNNDLQTAILYTIIYFLALLAAFGVIIHLSTKERDADQLNDIKGLFWSKPALAAIMTVAMLSLAGIPLTAGFIGKFYLLKAGINTQQWLLMFTLILGSVIGLFYYLRIIVAMFSEGEIAVTETEQLHPAYYIVNGTTLGVFALGLVYLGLYPHHLIVFIQQMLR